MANPPLGSTTPIPDPAYLDPLWTIFNNQLDFVTDINHETATLSQIASLATNVTAAQATTVAVLAALPVVAPEAVCIPATPGPL